MDISSKWCPECAQFTTHVGVECAGCDMEKEKIDELAEKELNGSRTETESEVQEETPDSKDTQEEKSAEENTQKNEDWILCEEKKAEFGGESIVYYEELMEANSKEKCEEEIGEESSILKYAEDLFFCKGLEETYFIGRPEAFEESGMSVE